MMKTGQINDQDYKELYLQTKQLYADMMTVYDELKKQVELLQQENFLLKETNEYYRKKLFGTKSETARSLGFEQLSLFDEAETILGENPGYVDITYKRKKKHKKVPGEISAKFKNLPKIKRLLDIPKEDRYCEQCGSEMVRVGEEFVRNELKFTPPKLELVEVYRTTYECRNCRKHGKPHMIKAEVPANVIPHSYASADSVAYIMVQKYVNAVTLYRQEQTWKHLGAELSRATMSSWMVIAAREWLYPLIRRMHSILIDQKYIHADETTVQVLKEKDKKNTSKSYMWVYTTHKYSKTPIRLFDYQPNRKGIQAKEYLEGFSGSLITDAYAGYDQINGVEHCYCWAHLRRYFTDALPKDLKSMNATYPKQAIEKLQKIFHEEALLEDLDAETRQRKRKEIQAPMVEEFFAWIETNKDKVLASSKCGKAFHYALNQKAGLIKYLEDGNIPMTNSIAERAIRPFTVGRKNWLFNGGPQGAKASAAIYSIVETAKANELDPYKYLNLLFNSLPGLDFIFDPSLLDDYLPWCSDIKTICK